MTALGYTIAGVVVFITLLGALGALAGYWLFVTVLWRELR